jgi:predicted nucleic acid-binding protein
VKLVADANVLLSAVLGGKSALILKHPEIESVSVAEPIFAEVLEYAPLLARKKKLSEDVVLLAVQSLPVLVTSPEVYASRKKEALLRIGDRDPEDADTLALALLLKAPIWSNDSDFKDARTDWFTTAQLLARLIA